MGKIIWYDMCEENCPPNDSNTKASLVSKRLRLNI